MVFRKGILPGLVLGVVGLLGGEEGYKPPFGFGAPEVIKLDWATRSLTPADLDGDGLQDLVVANNDTGKIELLYQRAEGVPEEGAKRTIQRSRWEPVMEDARFAKQSLTVGFAVFDLVVHDLNNDGRVDLAYTSAEVPLTIRYQDEAGEWVDSQEYDGFEALGWTNTIQASDVDGDGRAELFVLSADAIRIFRQGEDGLPGEPERLFVSGENVFNLMLDDATGDGLQDLLYLSSDGKQVLAMREQLGGTSFGPERRHVMERPARIVVPLASGASGLRGLGAVNSRSGSLEFMRLRATGGTGLQKASVLEQTSPEIYPIFKKEREDASYALGDLDGDGEADLTVANPAQAELVFFRKTGGRFAAPESFPSFSSVSSLSAGRFFDGETEQIVVLSESEKSLGLSFLDANRRISFPLQIKVGEGETVVSGAFDLDGDGYDELVLINRLEGAYELLVAGPDERSDRKSLWRVVYEMPLKGIKRKPDALSLLDMFDPQRPGLIVFVPRESPVLLGPAGEEAIGFKALAEGSSIRESLLKSVRPAEISFFDMDGDGSHELVVGRTGFARAFRFAGDDLEMVDQINARRGSDRIDAVIPVAQAAGPERVAIYISEAGELQLLRKDISGVFRYEHSVKVGQLKILGWRPLPASSREGEAGYLLFGEDRFWYFNSASESYAWVTDAIYETDLEDVRYTHLAAADFNGDGTPELVALDGNENLLDLLVQRGDHFESYLFWQVFEQNMHYQGRTGSSLEPRQVVIQDLSGDGKKDIALLVHDRILIYPQK